MGHTNASRLATAAKLEELYGVLAAAGMGPGWNKPEPSLWPSPKSRFLPAHWSYEGAKPALDSASRLIETEFAEQRSLILFNPVPGNSYATVRTLITAYQMVMPGETSRNHRHTPNALRLVMDAGPGAYTVVDDKKIPMLPGDVLIQPNWCWHGLQNDGAESAYWIQFVDVPLVHFLEPMFVEPHPAPFEGARAVDERSPMRFAFAQICERLDAQPEAGPGAREVELGPPHLDTMALHVARLEAGAGSAAPRSTANSIFAVIDGRGRSTIDGREFEWRRGDVFVVPAWRGHAYRALERSHLLRVSDEPVLRKLNWLRTIESPSSPKLGA
jgi:gentisate 1,2-dioxygenase